SQVVVFHVEAFRRRFRSNPVDLRLAPRVLATYTAERGMKLLQQLQPMIYWTPFGTLCFCFSFSEPLTPGSILTLGDCLRELFPRFALDVSHSQDPKAHIPGPTKAALVRSDF